MHKLALYIFHRDLRLDDNTSLIKALQNSDKVIPLFICTPTQIDNNKYKSSNSIQFMMESLFDLDNQIRNINPKCQLWIAYGEELSAVHMIHKKLSIDAVYINADYTPFALKRDKALSSFCEKNKIDFHIDNDILLTNTVDIAAKNGNRYRVFTQFYKTAIKIAIKEPDYALPNNFKRQPKFFKSWNIKNVDKYLLEKNFYQINPDIAVHGGRENGLKILKGLAKFKNYSKKRNILYIDTTMLSAHNKFGTVSIREVYFAIKKKTKSKDLIKQLYWRDFYYYIGFHFPEVYTGQHL
jgi:deoxyribodipyrimidine photo-lyase